MAGAGAAVGVAALAAPSSAGAAEESAALPTGAEGAMAAYVHDVRRGEVVLMIDGNETVVTDKKLVARLARAFAAAQR